MNGSRSLLDFVDTPVIVGDPDGLAVYANPAFERDFDRSMDSLAGEPLANLFEGGAREAVLSAVAGICAGEARVRFRLRQGAKGFGALASPVEVEGGRVGVVILLHEDRAGERVLSFRREVREPLEEIESCIVALSARATESDDARIRVAEGLRAIERIRKWADELTSETGRS